MPSSLSPVPGAGGRVVALLGPTNTGKTHAAIERMLTHRSGMIGLPLRLLAREVYDRVVGLRGADAVALVTGEEKIVPVTARYFVCTVEAMPTSRPVAFVAIDEVQLAADPERGRVFTDRILHARGASETWLMGSASMERLLRKLVPEVEPSSRPRLSTLRYAGEKRLGALPPRTAVIAFSADEVYALAERLRNKVGGVAVVLGALSPRARNAQVAMYQAGEVDYLVATDAIGMGLNLDVDHVAFTALRKFDGRAVRDLSAAEVGQIAGRAGRYTQDGTFGATSDLGPLPEELVAAVEGHAYPAVQRIYWRSRELDFRSVDALLDSLRAPPPHPALVGVREADDERALADLARDPAVRAAADDEASVSLLWDVAGIPDYRKTLTGAHAELLAWIFLALREQGTLPEAEVAQRLRRLDRTDGDIETLMSRIVYVRTWSYIAHRGGWLADSRAWQGETRAIEDRLSEALHAALTRRFVDERARALASRGGVRREARLEADGRVYVGNMQIGALDGLCFVPDRAVRGEPALERAARAAIGPAVATRAVRVLGRPEAGLSLQPDGRLVHAEGPVARAVRGNAPHLPDLAPLPASGLAPEGWPALRAALLASVRGLVAGWFAPLDVLAVEGPTGRALAWSLREGLGCCHLRELPPLAEGDRRRFVELGVVMLGRSAWMPALLSPETLAWRAALQGVWAPGSALPVHLGVALPAGATDAEACFRQGFVRAGAWAVRVDVAERLRVAHRKHPRPGRDELAEWAGWLGLGVFELHDVLRGL